MEKIILYGHPTCPGVVPAKGMLKQSKVEYDYINIRQNREAAEQVRAINDGYESVPTLVFPDGSTLTEPSARELKAKLEALGYKVSPLALIIGNLWQIMLYSVVLYAVLRFFEII